MGIRLFALAGLVLAAPAAAAPLAFGAIEPAADLSDSAELRDCEARGSSQLCRLTRTSFGGLTIERSEVLLNNAGRARTMHIRLDRDDLDVARQLLAGRYGPPQSDAAAHRWAGYDDGASITLAPSGREALVTFDFPANAAVQAEEPASPWPLLGLAALGLGAGWGIQRIRRRRPTLQPALAPQAPISMRATLERRVREGRDLSF